MHILRLATLSTLTADPLDTTRPISFLETSQSHLYLTHRLHHYTASMQQKAIFTLVNKSWNAFAQPALYEFVWLHRASQAKALAWTLLSQACGGGGVKGGAYIRRLHIETPSLERCCPADLRTVLDYAPQLVVYSDYRSVRRNLYEEACDPRTSPAQLFSALAHPKNSLRRLSWTNYDVSFHLHMSPMLETTAANLEFLELTYFSPDLHAITRSEDRLPPSSIALTLPALRSLKVTLDNATFAVLSTWSMPALTNLSVVSADFSYAGTGFSQFFLVHGAKLTQLELGHSTSTIEEHYLTVPPHQTHPLTSQSIPLAEWCPNLREFICSADAEWNWQNPDWIAPHILLPTHPKLEFLGIRDIDKRLLDDIDIAPPPPPQLSQADIDDDDTPFFMLLEQIGSLLREEAFPSLRYIRDMSWGSDVMRKTMGTPRGQGKRVSRFWGNVLERCSDRGVWLEDCHGLNVTLRDLRKAEAGVVDPAALKPAWSE